MSIGTNQEIRQCKGCNNEFPIEPADFKFYQKIQVPPPTYCPECRSQIRSLFRNEIIFYKRKCDFSGKEIISIFSGAKNKVLTEGKVLIYSQDKSFTVYDQDIWWSDTWDSLEYGKEYDFSKPFFEQFRELLLKVPRLSIINKQSVNSEYCNYSLSNKNCYLCFGGHYNEDCGYCWYNWKDKDCFDLLEVIKSELCYQCNFGSKLYRCAFLEYSFDSVDCYFGYNLRGCQNCFLSTNLRNKQYYILNKPYSKAEYERKVAQFFNGSYQTLKETLEQFKVRKLSTIRSPVYQGHCVNCIGSDLERCKNIYYGFNVEHSEDLRYAYHKITQTYSSMDVNKMGYDRSEFCYQTIGCAGLYNCKLCDSCWSNHDLTYCNLCFSSANLFGCIGIKNKKYCILNKQYTKESFDKLKAKIIEHMDTLPYKDKKGRIYRYGEFFPPELSPFAYNESTAQEYFPLTKEQAQEKGYHWRDRETHQRAATLKHDQLPDRIENVPDSITNEVISCQHEGKCNEQCTTAFRIISQELKFYRKMNLPLPRLCPYCRHHQRRSERNPVALWHRSCQCAGSKSDPSASPSAVSSGPNCSGFTYQNTIEHFHKVSHCPNEFETTYSAERKEIVYCEKCYQSEVA